MIPTLETDRIAQTLPRAGALNRNAAIDAASVSERSAEGNGARERSIDFPFGHAIDIDALDDPISLPAMRLKIF